ncbi:MAG: MarR family transcriptional regulator [Candidatus Buchananbacteria bacterium]|nr:MarR family transcriptional regulator [Candidatus Buchananbacteria bacterium]
MDRKKMVENILHNMHVLKHELMMDYAAQKNITITNSQSFVLLFVAKNNSANVKDIAKALHITSSATTQLIDGLTANGYLIRKVDTDDRRLTGLLLSPKAKNLFKEFKKQGLQKMIGLFSPLTDKELRQYADLNKKIVNNIINKE